MLSFVTTSQLNWIGHVSRMDSKRKASQVFNNNPQTKRATKNIRWNYVQRGISKCKIVIDVRKSVHHHT
jgi:hypothetical protein